MESIKEYTIVGGISTEELISFVNEKIKEGWHPIGGVSVILGEPVQHPNMVQNSISQQAMIR